MLEPYVSKHDVFVCAAPGKQGKYNGKSGYFPAKYVLKIEEGQHIYQVVRTINLTEMDGLSGIRLHKDQVSHSHTFVFISGFPIRF